MPNKTRYIIYPDRDYVIKLDDGDEVTITGLQIIELGYGIAKMDTIIRCFGEIEKENNYE